MEKAILRSEDGSPTGISVSIMRQYKELKSTLCYVGGTKELDSGAKESIVKDIEGKIDSLPNCGGTVSKVLSTMGKYKSYSATLNYLRSTGVIEPSAKEGVIEEIKSKIERLPTAAIFKAFRGGLITANLNGVYRGYNFVSTFFGEGFAADNLSDLVPGDVLYVVFDAGEVF